MRKKAGRRSWLRLQPDCSLYRSWPAAAGGTAMATPAAVRKDGNAGTPAASEGAAKAADTGIDTSKKVELQFYMLGDAPKDLPAIQAEVNKMAEADLNATVKFNFTSWTRLGSEVQAAAVLRAGD